MKIVMNRLEALSLAKAAESIAPSKATMDELRCVLLESGEDGKLTMAATNNEVALEQRMPAQIQEAGALLINAKLFANMLSVLGGETVTIQGEETAGRRRSQAVHAATPSRSCLCPTTPARRSLPGGHRDRQEYPQHGRPDGLCGRGGMRQARHAVRQTGFHQRRIEGGELRRLPSGLRQG